jgi:hypothetical protein
VSQSFEERIFDAVVGQFFAPQPTVEFVYNPATGQSEPRPGHAPSASARVAADIWAQQREQILVAVKERLVIEEVAAALAEKITKDTVERLTSTRPYSGFDRDHGERADRRRVGPPRPREDGRGGGARYQLMRWSVRVVHWQIQATVRSASPRLVWMVRRMNGAARQPSRKTSAATTAKANAR